MLVAVAVVLIDKVLLQVVEQVMVVVMVALEMVYLDQFLAVVVVLGLGLELGVR